jgi:threonine synthase
MITVSDAEILEAMRATARLAGVFGEPAGVAGVAGLRRAVASGMVGRDQSALVVITGNGLKDIQAARAAAGREHILPPSMDALEKILRTA